MKGIERAIHSFRELVMNSATKDLLEYDENGKLDDMRVREDDLEFVLKVPPMSPAV
jgi:hypothetical protein